MKGIDQTHPYLAASWTNEDLQRLVDFRREVARAQQVAGVSKDERKHYLRQEKACTILLHYFNGTGEFSNRASSQKFPDELQPYIQFALNRL